MPSSRKKFIINTNFQVKFSLLILLPLAVLSMILPYTIYQSLASISHEVQKINPEIAEKILKMRSSYINVLILLEIFLLFSSFIFCLLITHRIAGSLFKLQQYLKKIREGKTVESFKLRKTDYFQEIAVDMSKTIQYLKESSREKSN